ncbi:hypothetical protein Bhyg_14193 [Pseudolycoriella hygida]|uniref:Uncharacterized protein n=1 Tax=Pseudolycoriella hygida TaxID=35572 RepID=A0A9Q0RX72_9DIPT|nr:hypothetical protein Bhyg_14193 [Pseudolycoriella hygida]
MILRRAINL